MGATAAVHPTDQTLQCYGLGKLDDASSESVSKHLETCDPCQRRVAELSSDEFLGRLRNAQIKSDKSVTSWSPSAASPTEGASGLVVRPPPADTLPPELVDHPDYEIVRELGRGGMGVVYLAQNKLMGRPEVLKVVGRHLVERPGVGDRFLREIRSAAKLHHPNIVTAHSAIRLGESLVLAMEYVEGLDLAKMVKTKGPLPIAHACYFIHQAALGLQHAHERGMVHRDIKPANLILARDGKKPIVKVLDFGLAKVTSEGQTDSGLTREGQMLGTPDYIAPEQIRNAQSADIRADIYSLGCTFYYLLTGGPPFRGDHLWDVYQAHFSMEAGPLNLVRPEVPVELAAVVAKMMAKEPCRRFQTPGDVARALTPFFKTGGMAVKVANPEISQARQLEVKESTPGAVSAPLRPATERTPAAASEARKPAPPQPGSILGGLIDLRETEPLFDKILDTALPVAALKGSLWNLRPWPTAVEKLSRFGPRASWAAAGVLLLGLVVACVVVVMKVKTANGTIVLENVPADAVVEIDGDRITVTPTVGEPVKIEVSAGNHGVLVKRGNDVLLGESVTVESGKHFKLTARLESPVVERQEKTEPSAANQAADVVPPRMIDRSRFTIASGQWHVERDELVQTDATQSYSELLFGDNQWTDYDFSVEAMRAGGGNSFSLFFRSTDRNNRYAYVVSGDDNKSCWVEFLDQIYATRLDRYDFGIKDHRWYTARVHVRGDHFVCSLYDHATGTDMRLFDFHDERHPKGRVGLQTFGSSVRFKKIKVTSPDGKVLWEGPPAVDSMTPSEFSKPPDQAKPSVDGQDGFVQLFNGIDLTGWKTHPQQPGDWHVENGNLVGSGPAAISHLYTVRDDYKDFHLRAEARINEAGNSGVYFRAPFGPTWPANDRKFPIAYEAQIYSKPGGQIYTGSLYAGTEAVVNFNVRPVLPSDWGTLEVIARGNHVVVKVNGITTADYIDVQRLFSRGHIALQQHGPQTIVEFRKVEIKEFTPASFVAVPKTQLATPIGVNGDDSRTGEGFVPLFNGKDLTGWRFFGGDPDIWHVDDGDLVATALNDWRKQTFLLSERDFSDFSLRFEFQLPKNTDSGVVLRAIPGEHHMELNLRNFDEPAGVPATAALNWSTSGKGEDYLPPDRPAELVAGGAWNEMEIILRGASLRVSVNRAEVRSTDLRKLANLPGALPSLKRRSGRIGFQSHTGTVRFRNIEIQELSPSSPAAYPKPERTTAKAELAPSARNSKRSNVEKNSIPRKAAKDKVADAFQPGTVWTGKRVLFIDGAAEPQELSSTFTVREREGKRFKARYVLGKDAIFEVNGTIEDNDIRWVARDVKAIEGYRGPDPFDYAYAGTIRNDQISMTFAGSHAGNGKRISGTLNVRLEK